MREEQRPAGKAGIERSVWQNAVKYWRYCRTYGLAAATRLAWQRLRRPRGAPPIHVKPLSPPPIAGSSVARIEKTISVVIPTKNAGQDLGFLLRKLKAQAGVTLAQTVVVDSGSSDGTVALAQAEGAQVIQIAPQEFSHAAARNRGAETCGGDYLLFMVQDALPLTNVWLWEMATTLEKNDVAAVSCAEFPRADSDFFYQFLIHEQYDSPGRDGDRLLAWDDSCSSYLGLRANAQLSSVAALIRRDVFARYGYRTAYAEDVDLGVRLIRDGYKLGFLCSTRVLHSHNRPAYYFLKRGYTDVRYLGDVFANFTYPEVSRREKMYADICYLQQRVAHLNQAAERLSFPQETKSLLEHLRAQLCSSACNGEAGLGDADLGTLMGSLCRVADAPAAFYAPAANMILPHVLRHFDLFGSWLAGIYTEADPALAREVVSGIEKIFALHCGNHLAYAFLTASHREALDDSSRELDKRLRAGV